MSLFDSLKKVAQTVAAPGPDIRKVTLSSLPSSVEEMRALPEFDRKDPFVIAALTVAAFCVYPVNKDIAIGMLNDLKGPSPLSAMDISFIRDRFMDGKDYLPHSYFEGATPDNGYEPAALIIPVKEQPNSRDAENTITLYLISGGADSPRPITLRQKPSTGEWFLWEFRGILAGIRVPKSQDPWA